MTTRTTWAHRITLRGKAHALDRRGDTLCGASAADLLHFTTRDRLLGHRPPVCGTCDHLDRLRTAR